MREFYYTTKKLDGKYRKPEKEIKEKKIKLSLRFISSEIGGQSILKDY